MADINVALALNDSQYTSKLAAAQAQAAKFGSTFAGAADVVKNKMEGLGAVIAGVGLLEFGKSALESVSHMADLAGSIGITTQSMMEMTLAGAAAGKSGDDMAMMMQKLNIATNSANEGNTKMQSSFLALGLSMEQVNRMHPDDRFAAIVSALGSMEDPTKRAALGLELLSKKGTMADFKDIANNIEKYSGSQEHAAEASKVAKEVMDKMAVSAILVKNEFVALAKPVLEWIEPFVGGANSAKVAAETLAGAMVLFTGAAIVTGVRAVGGAVASLAGFFGIGAVAATAEAAAIDLNSGATARNAASKIAGLAAKVAVYEQTVNDARANFAWAVSEAEATIATNTLTTTTWRLAAAKASLAEASAMVGVATVTEAGAMTTATVATTGLAAAGAALGNVLKTLVLPIVAIGAAAGALQAIYGLIKGNGGQNFINDMFDDLIGNGKEAQEIEQQLNKLTASQREAYNKMDKAGQDAVLSALRQKDQMAAIAKATALLNNEPVKKEKEEVVKPPKTAFDRTAIVGWEEQTKAIQQTIEAEQAKERFDRTLIGKSNTSVAYDKTRYEEIAAFDKEELRIRGEINKVRAQAQFATDIGDEVKGKQLAAQIPFLEKQLAIRKEAIGIMATEKQLTEVAKNEEQMRLFYMESEKGIQQEIQDIQRTTRQLTMTEDQRQLDNISKRIEAETRAAIAIREKQQGGHPLDQEDKDAIAAAMDAKYRKRLEATNQAEIDTRRSFRTGWEKAFNDYKDNATNAAEEARNAFNAFANAFESAFDQMVKTGKVNWRSLLQDMTAELIKSDVKKLFVSLMSPTGSQGATSGGLFASIGKFFAGGFATGGMIPAGGFGLVGENGPEFISGPANITPMNTGGTTMVTYNINATDARSFQQLLAQQPDLIHALVQKTQRSLPGGR